jgi:beta-galactosidase
MLLENLLSATLLLAATAATAQNRREYLMGEFVWTGFDYLGEPTPYNEKWPSHSSYFGMLDLAGMPKDRYYLYHARWNTAQPTLHLLPHWTWPGREGQTTSVFAYTSYPSAELFVNGQSQGRQTKGPTTSPRPATA